MKPDAQGVPNKKLVYAILCLSILDIDQSRLDPLGRPPAMTSDLLEEAFRPLVNTKK